MLVCVVRVGKRKQRNKIIYSGIVTSILLIILFKKKILIYTIKGHSL